MSLLALEMMKYVRREIRHVRYEYLSEGDMGMTASTRWGRLARDVDPKAGRVWRPRVTSRVVVRLYEARTHRVRTCVIQSTTYGLQESGVSSVRVASRKERTPTSFKLSAIIPSELFNRSDFQ